MLGAIASVIVPKLLDGIFGTVDQLVEDKDKANEIKQAISEMAHERWMTEIKGGIEIVLAETKGGWLQRNWRPILMMTFIVMLWNNFILVPYLVSFGLNVVVLPFPAGAWGLLTAGVSGYVVARTVEKVAPGVGTKMKDWMKNKKDVK